MPTRLRACSSAAILSIALGLAPGCAPEPARAPALIADGGGPFLVAFRAEQARPDDPLPWLEALDLATRAPDAPGALALGISSLDALVGMGPGRPNRVSPAIAFRSRSALQHTVLRLREAWDALAASEARHAALLQIEIAAALHELALHGGEARGAEVWSSRRGCARRATVLGPLDAAPLAALSRAPLVPGAGPVPDRVPGLGPFAPATITTIDADACGLDPRSTSRFTGLRELVVDVEVPTAQRLSVRLVTPVPATLFAGDARVLERGADVGEQPSVERAVLDAPAGILRFVVRIADRGDANDLALDVVGEGGAPLRMAAPAVGNTADARPTDVRKVELSAPEGASDGGLALLATAELASGHPRRAEHALEASLAAAREGRDPAVHLVFVRAMELASDMAESRKLERTQASVAAIRAAGGEAGWETKLLEVELVQRKKGFGEGTFEALGALGVPAPDADLAGMSGLELAAVVELASRIELTDLAERAYDELAARAPGSALLARVDASLHPRTGKEAARAACEGGLPRHGTLCTTAKLQVGDRQGALKEIARLRALRGSPTAFAGLELNVRLAQGDDAGALAAYELAPAGERALGAILPVIARTQGADAARARARAEAPYAPDGPVALVRMNASLGEPSSEALRLERAGRALIEADRKQPSLPGAATAVLQHVEHYGLDRSGLLQVLVYDVRRVAGTTDVDQGTFVEQPSVDGRGGVLPLRRRVHKKDGRVLEPEAANMAQQGGTELSQLEQGDYVETLLEGWYTPTEAGELTLDTPDLLPERTSVKQAEVAIRLPADVSLASWVHPALGTPTETTQGGYRTATYRLGETPARRIEDGLPPLERGVRVSLGTQSWQRIGLGIGEVIRGMADADPAVSRFAAEARGADTTDPRALVERVVRHVGSTVKVASGGELTDFAGAYGGGGTSARAIIEDGQGSRTWLVYRTLRELGVPADIAVAETAPFATTASFPPHPGRFRHPLVVARIPGGDVWIDADVEGPPLPPGRISPELRGRSAILPDGAIIAVPAVRDDAADEVGIELTLDERGTAHGKVRLALRGRPAQALSESFNYVVGSDRTEMLRGVVQAWLPTADVDDVALSSEEGSWEVTLTATVTIAGMCTPRGTDGAACMLPGFEPVHGQGSAGTLAQAYATRGARQSALQIDAPLQYRVRRTITLPPGAKVAGLAAPVGVDRPFLGARRTTAEAQRGDRTVIEEELTMNLPTGTIPAEGYRAFLDAVQAVDAGFLAGTRVRWKP